MDSTVTDQTNRCRQLSNQCFLFGVLRKFIFWQEESERQKEIPCHLILIQNVLMQKCIRQTCTHIKSQLEEKHSSEEVKYYRSLKTAGGWEGGAKAIKTPKAKTPQQTTGAALTCTWGKSRSSQISLFCRSGETQKEHLRSILTARELFAEMIQFWIIWLE